MTPNCENTHGALTWIMQDTCFMTVDKRHVHTALIGAGYLIYDFIILFFYVGADDMLAIQTIGHHFIGTTGLFVGVKAGYGAPGIGNLSLMCELSTFFMNYRSMFPKDQINEFVPQMHQLLFFIAFTVFRMCLFPFGIYLFFMTWYYSFDYVDSQKHICLGISTSLYIVMLILNIYWYQLILKGLLKMLGCIKVNKKKVDVKK